MVQQFKNQLNKIEKLLTSIKQNEVEFMDMEDASKFLKLKKSTIYQLTCKKEIPRYKITKKNLFKKNELVEWVEKSKIYSNEELQNNISLNQGEIK